MEILPHLDKVEGKFSRKDIIIKEATKMFRARGYSSSSVRDLAQLVGIEAPSIYSHFKSKENILNHICFEMGNAFILGIEKAECEKDQINKLLRAIHEHIEVIIFHKEASIVMWNEWRFLTKPAYQQFQIMIKDYENRFKDIIEMGMKSGVFKKKNPEICSNLILTAMNNLGHWYKGDYSSSKELENEIVDIYLKGILK